MPEEKPMADARVRIQLGTGLRHICFKDSEKTVRAVWIGPPHLADSATPVELGAVWGKNPSEMIVKEQFDEGLAGKTDGASFEAGDGINLIENPGTTAGPEYPNTITIETKGPNTTYTVLDSINWPYSVQVKDVTYEGGVLISVGAPYEDT